MKRITAIALLAIANFAMAGTSFAQSKMVKANVPFDFTVGKQLLPAGTYTIKAESSGLIAIKNHDKPITVLTIDCPGRIQVPKRWKADLPQVRRPVLPERDSLRLRRIWTSQSVLLKQRKGFSCSKQWSNRAARSSLLPANGVIGMEGPGPKQTSGLLMDIR